MKKSETKQDILNDLKIVNFKTHKGHDGDGFNLDLVYKGKKICTVYDDAWGGEYQVHAIGKFDSNQYKANETLLSELSKRIESLPKEHSKELDFWSTPNLDILVSELTTLKSIEKDSKKGVLVKTSWGWNVVGFKTSIPTTIKRWSDGLEAIQEIYNEEIKKGSEVLNKDYLKSVGINL